MPALSSKRTAPLLVDAGLVFGRLTATAALYPFTEDMKSMVATAVRAPRTAQALPVTDGKEVSA